MAPEDYAEDIDCEFALHFDIWNIDEKAQQECFALFPKGLEILARANQVRAIVPQSTPVKDEELLKHVDDMNKSITKVLALTGIQRAIKFESTKSTSVNRRVYRGDNDLRLKLMRKADNPTVSLDDELDVLFEEKLGDEGYATYSYLREPLYRIANSIVIRNSILWAALVEEYGIDPYAPVMELYKCNAQAGWAEDEMFVFQFSDEQ